MVPTRTGRIGSLAVEQTTDSGLGLSTTKSLKDNDLLITVPTSTSLSVECPGDGPDHYDCFKLLQDRSVLRNSPWYAQFSVYLHMLDKVSSVRKGLDMRPWLETLPRSFSTPIHWESTDELQYQYLQDSVVWQKQQWKAQYTALQDAATSDLAKMSWEDFVWGCECARSRVFSGAFTGSAFNPAVYVFTLALVAAYVGLGMGSIEDAANGAAVVVCGTILKDFVVPKLFKTKRYVICPVIDMANHRSTLQQGDVSFEFFGDAYSLAATQAVNQGSELFISYGPRSNDQLLQFYGFVEPNNPHDVYIMPPLREWDIAAIEQACERTIAPGRLQKLDRAGLLGSTFDRDSVGEGVDAGNTDDVANAAGGVVVTRAGGIDPAVIQALRALISSDEEWTDAGEAVGNFATENSGGIQNERLARLAAKTAMRMELDSKPTTAAEDEKLLKQMRAGSSSASLDYSEDDELAVMFRLEKKKLLQETIDKIIV